MARIRTLKPDLWQSESLGSASVDAQCLFVGLITQADDHGRLRGSPSRLRATIWPYKPEIDAARVDQLLDELAARELIQRYHADGKPHVFLTGWYEHQRIQRPSDSELPPPPAPHSGTAQESSANTLEDARKPQDGSGSGSGSGEGETPSSSEASLAPTVRNLFAYWQQRCRHPQARLTAERRRKCEARLREGYTEEQGRTAIDGAARAAFVNDQGKRFDDFELIFRSGSKLEDFVDRAKLNGAGPAAAPDAERVAMRAALGANRSSTAGDC